VHAAVACRLSTHVLACTHPYGASPPEPEQAEKSKKAVSIKYPTGIPGTPSFDINGAVAYLKAILAASDNYLSMFADDNEALASYLATVQKLMTDIDLHLSKGGQFPTHWITRGNQHSTR